MTEEGLCHAVGLFPTFNQKQISNKSGQPIAARPVSPQRRKGGKPRAAKTFPILRLLRIPDKYRGRQTLDPSASPDRPEEERERQAKPNRP
jgi:hypothetical protein